MSWKCVCKEENMDEAKKCNNCGRKRPSYLGVKLDIDPSAKLTNDQLAVYYLMMAYDSLGEASEIRKLHDALVEGTTTETSLKLGTFRARWQDMTDQGLVANELNKECKFCLSLLEKVKAIDPNVQMESSEGVIHSCSSIESDCYFLLGDFDFDRESYSKAIDYYQKSYDADPNQVSIYNIAMATANLAAEGGGIFSGKKKAAAAEAKVEQEMELLKKTIKFGPFSRLGIKSGRMLLEKYKLTELDI